MTTSGTRVRTTRRRNDSFASAEATTPGRVSTERSVASRRRTAVGSEPVTGAHCGKGLELIDETPP
ncbi:hypothetical protein [Streptomyces himastatinicus]|uniref:hypothetical protein n=1 Tax=Streptomyces himastatinicus TaxID=998084 RepID=UPI0005867818|nr:hypothetical protein [Streptomyces himastatinicus]